MIGGHLEPMGCQLFMKKTTKLDYFNSTKLMQLHFKIAFKALWHSMNGGHPKLMGCQLCLKKVSNRNFLIIDIKLMQLQFFIALKALWHLVNGSHLEWVE